jgi:spore maturation protein CgeB
MYIVLAYMAQSPYNRSIWMGFARAFRALGHTVQEAEADRLPPPASYPTRPDLLFAVHGGNVPTEVVDNYRAEGIKTAVYLLDEPYEVERSRQWARHYDWVFSVDRATVPVHAAHAQAAFLPLAYDDQVFSSQGPAVPSEILMLGSPFRAREELLAPLRDSWGGRITWVGPGWKKFSNVGRHYEGFVSPDDCARFYRGAGIVINIHRDSFWSHFGDLNPDRITATHLNPRFWEAGACGGLALVHARAHLQRYAPPGLAFNTAQELDQKLEYFMSNERARKDLARRLHRAVKDHTYVKRAQTVLETIQSRVSRIAD